MNVRAGAERLWRELNRYHRGKAVGTIVGLLGGWFGSVMGFVIGYMMDALLAQRNTERAVAAYLENPGPSPFIERIPGSAAFCALAAAVMAADGEGSPSRIERLARDVFGSLGEDPTELETFSRVAAAQADALNPDLLAESLRARRKNTRDEALVLRSIGDALENLASGELAKETAFRVSELISPGKEAGRGAENPDPYLILGLSPDSALDEVKTVYRRLAVRFHPDAAVGLDEDQAKSSAEAFLRIDEAYRRILADRVG